MGYGSRGGGYGGRGGMRTGASRGGMRSQGGMMPMMGGMPMGMQPMGMQMMGMPQQRMPPQQMVQRAPPQQAPAGPGGVDPARLALMSPEQQKNLLGEKLFARIAVACQPELPLPVPYLPCPELRGAAAVADLTDCVSSAMREEQAALATAITALNLEETGVREEIALGECADFYALRRQLREALNGVLERHSERCSSFRRRAEQAVHAMRSACASLHGVLRETEQDMEQKLRRLAEHLEQRHHLQLQHACSRNELGIEADDNLVRLVSVKVTLKQELGVTLRAAALARTMRIDVSYTGASTPADAPPEGVYLRTFAGPQWEHVQGGAVAAVLHCPDAAGFGYRIARGDEVPIEAAVRGGALRCGRGGQECLRLPSGSSITLTAMAWAEAPTLPGFRPELLHEAKRLPQLAAPLGPDSKLHGARSKAWRQRIMFREWQQRAQSAAADHRIRAERDAARVAAREAQEQLVAALRSEEVGLACGEGRQRELEELAGRLAACTPSEARKGGELPQLGPAAASAHSAAERALQALDGWQSHYNLAVRTAEGETDAALAAAQRFDEKGAPPLPKLLMAIRAAAAEEGRLRALSKGVTPPPRAEFNEAAHMALDAIDAMLGAAVAVREELGEAEAVLAELTEGTRHAGPEGGFYDRVERFAGRGEVDCPEVDPTQSYEDAKQELKALRRLQAKGNEIGAHLIRQAEQEVQRTKALAEGSALTTQVLQLQGQAKVVRAQMESSNSPERRREHEHHLDATLQQLRVARRESAAEGAELLRIASVHFPECLERLEQGIQESLVGRVPLRLLLGGGTLDEFTPISGERGGRLSCRHRVYRAESSEGEVVIKQVSITHQVALASFVRSVRMAEAAGDVAARLRRVFVDGEWGCLVMDSYPHSLRGWAAQEGDQELRSARALRMAQLLLERMVRLHSPVPDFPEGVVHGDITPANIVVDSAGVPFFIDFETARTACDDATGTVDYRGITLQYAAPELHAGSVAGPVKKTTKATDIYGMGATLKELVTDVTGPAKDELLKLCARMTNRDPALRPTAIEALAASEVTAAVGAQMRERQAALAAQQREAEAAAARAEQKRREVQDTRRQVDERLATLAGKAAQLKEEHIREQKELQKRAEELSGEAKRQAAEADQLHKKRDAVAADVDKLRREFYTAPRHWSGGRDLAQGWRAVHIPDKSDVYACLAKCLATDPAKLMAHGGRDRKVRGTFSRFELQRAWRIEHPTRWREFAFKRESIRHDIASGRLPKCTTPLLVRRELAEALGPKRTDLPEPLHHGGGVNELRLFHGTEPGSLLGIISGGMNERLCGKNGTRFGDGTYFAEEAAKSNGYCTPHRSNSLPDLEGRFYRDGVSHPGGDVYYMFVCRVVCGCFVTTKNGTKSVPGDHYIFATSNRRELAFPPEVGPTGARYTSILADPGGHREFIVFNGQQVYTEYVLACHRK
eukprot:TRINITY_DN171_c1_g1_i4.p1 TRINITY_DN171_c1_g1~~TRINITY_DN171_c1_g1_i4.p1  ORF type:complete len:1476 (+),score=402.40 TRINITY_DN171_c1_g1_i4:88-4428(+)